MVLPRCNTEAMALHLQEISRAVKLSAHADVLLDQAGWHGSKELEVPDNITLFPLPPRSPELNPVENLWPLIRDNFSTTAATPRTVSSSSPGKSFQSEPVNGHMSDGQWERV